MEAERVRAKAEAEDRVRRLQEELERKERQISLVRENSIAGALLHETSLREEVKAEMKREGWAVRAVFPHLSRTSSSSSSLIREEEQEEEKLVVKEEANEEQEVNKEEEEEALALAAEIERLSRVLEDERTRGVELIKSCQELKQMVHTLQYQVWKIKFLKRSAP
jgi:hypothetical protein